jgi:hypothetical protein
LVVAGRGGDGAGLGGAVGVRDGIDMPGIAWFIAPDDIPDPDGVRCPPISCAPTTPERTAGAIAMERIRDLPPILSIVGSPRASAVIAHQCRCYRQCGWWGFSPSCWIVP